MTACMVNCPYFCAWMSTSFHSRIAALRSECAFKCIVNAFNEVSVRMTTVLLSKRARGFVGSQCRDLPAVRVMPASPKMERRASTLFWLILAAEHVCCVTQEFFELHGSCLTTSSVTVASIRAEAASCLSSFLFTTSSLPATHCDWQVECSCGYLEYRYCLLDVLVKNGEYLLRLSEDCEM